MAAGDQLRKAAQQSKSQAKQQREQSQEMRKHADELQRMASKSEAESPILERQASDADSAEQRANDIRNST